MDIDPIVPGFIVLVRSFLSPERCRELILWSEQHGYEEARLSDGSRRTDVRNNDRIIHDDVELASRWFEHIREALPELPFATACGLNERFRFYRYHPGQRFRHHTDGVFQRNDREFSNLTLLAYLNDDFKGGATAFTRMEVAPETGAVLLFQHRIEHAGASVLSGTKYVLRTDVMYRLHPEDK